MRHLLVLALALAAPAGAQLLQSGPTSPLGFNNPFTVADFNLDGWLDIAVGRSGSGTLAVGFGSSGGGFAFTPSAETPADTPGLLLAGDFNGDGKKDVVVFSGTSLGGEARVRVLLGNGAGTFTSGAPLVLPSFVRAADVGDFDSDGNLDVAIVTSTSGNSMLTLLKGDGNGGLTIPLLPPAQALPVPSQSTIDDMQTVFLNNGPEPDLVMTVIHSTGIGLVTALGNGQGAFNAIATLGNLPPQGLQPRSKLAIGDFNSDGRTDAVMFGYRPGEVTLWTNSGSGSLSPQAFASVPVGTNLYSIAAGDFDLNGRMDWAVTRQLVSPETVPQLFVALGNGFGSFLTAPGSPYAFGGQFPLLESGDFNGDRRTDLLVVEGTSAEVIRTLLNTSSGVPTLVAQQIDFPAIAERGRNESPFTPAVESSSGLPVSLASLTDPVCTVKNNAVTLITMGTCTLVATQAGSLTVSPAPVVQRSFTVGDIRQTIDFAPLSAKTLDSPPFTVTATASSGLPVSFTAAPPGVCTISGATVTLVGIGECSITASQAGNTEYPPAVPVVRTFAVGPGAPPRPTIESVVNGASYARGTLAPSSYGSAFGVNFGTTPGVTLRDSAGNSRALEVTFASTTQINFVIPAGVALGQAVLTVANAVGPTEAALTIEAIAPGLFSSAGTGQGLAAAQVLILNPDQTVTARLVTDGPIPLLPGTEVYLVLYGTGIRGHAGNVFVTVGGRLAEVTYAGPQGVFPGLDQVNVRIPRELAGQGLADIQLLVDGRGANAVQANFQ